MVDHPVDLVRTEKKTADLNFFPPILAVMQNVGMTDKKLQIL